jgi:hypothetical protein
MSNDYHIDARRVRFIPVKDGDIVELGDSGLPAIAGRHKLIGFKPGPGPRPNGWIVVLIDEAAPKKGMPRKHRSATKAEATRLRAVG